MRLGGQRVSEARIPDEPGVYIVWRPDDGGARPLYVGVAATQTLSQRWRRQHLVDRAGGSALRRSLGVHLGLVERKLSVKRDGHFYPYEVEAAISRFLRSCRVEFFTAAEADEARAQEERVIGELHPVLNIRRRPRITRTAEEKAVFAAGRRLYPLAKAALTQGLKQLAENVQLDPASDYVVDIQSNLLPGIELTDIEDEFEGGGNELEWKMRAPWSSSALAVNSFARWRHNLDRLQLAGRSGFETGMKFEASCPNGVAKLVDPHLDVLLRRPGEVVGVESKCTEYIQGSDHPPVAASYRRLAEAGDQRASSRWFAALDRVEAFLLLDGYQLVKHYLGLRLTYPTDRLVLVYLFWEPQDALQGPGGELFTRHRHEIALFADLVEGDETCAFVARSYPEHWSDLADLSERPGWLGEHLELLRLRYQVGL